MSTDEKYTESPILGRLDERTIAIQESLKSFRAELTSLRDEIQKTNENISSKFISLQSDIDIKIEALRIEIADKYISKERFTPVEKIVYSVVGLILTAVVVGLLSLVIIK